MARDPGTGASKSIYRQQTPKPSLDPVVGTDPGLGVSVTLHGKSLDAHGKKSPTVSASKVLDNLATPVLGEPFSQTNIGKLLLHGDPSGFKNTLQPPNGGAGMINAGAAPFPVKVGGLVDMGAAKVGKGLGKTYRPRTLKAGDLEQQIPKARSRITRNAIEEPADKVSTTLDKSARARATPGVRLATASERAVKAAGRAQRRDRGRVVAQVQQHLNAIKAVKAGSPEDVANFWYAQLPKTHRNAEGLQAVQTMQRNHLEDLASGKALADANARQATIEDALKTAQGKARFDLMGALEDVKLFKSDIPNQIRDVSGSLAQLEGVIAKAPVPNEAAIAAVHALGNDSANVLVDANRLDPAKAEPRKYLLSDALGLSPTREIPPAYRAPEGALFHGSPDGELENIDALYHTKMWREGPGFYATTSPEKAAQYAAGKTARAERRTGAGVINVVKLKPGAKVLDLDAQGEDFWRHLAEESMGEKIDPKTYHDWASLAHDDRDSPHMKGASDGIRHRNGFLEFMTGYDEMPKTEAYYALEEALHAKGYQATLHHEGGVPVYIVKDENAVERAGVVNPADLAPTSEPDRAALTGVDAPAYIGHRQPRPEGRFPFTPKGGTGRVATPAGMTSQNKLVLARTGRLRQSLHVATEDWGSTQVFRQANVARDTLGKIGSPFTGHVPQDSVLINPAGRTVPPNWKTEDLAQFGDSFEDVAALRRKAQQIVDEFSADGSDPAAVERLKQHASEQGVQWDELRVVPRRLVDRYYDQYRSSVARGKVGKGYDTLVDLVATSIVIARVGYIPKNLVQNVVLSLPHQGPLFLRNATWAAQAMRDPELRAMLKAETGQGANAAIAGEALHKKVIGKVAGFNGAVADDLPRIAAFLHEAAAEKVINGAHPFLTDGDRAKLLGLLRDERHRPLLNDINTRSNDAMADFTRLTPDQSRLARRLLIVPGWLMAGTRYPFHFAATHPIRSMLLAYIALGEPGAPDHFNKPINEYFTGSSYKRGIQTPLGRVRTGSISPVSTPAEIAGSVAQTVRGKSPFDITHNTVFDYANPFLSSVVGAAQGGGILRNAERLVPNLGLIQDLIHPSGGPNYPEDATRLGRLKREIGVAPIQVNDNTSTTSRRGSSGGSGSIYRSGGGSSSSGSIYRR
jgi:hypothetical protein